MVKDLRELFVEKPLEEHILLTKMDAKGVQKMLDQYIKKNEHLVEFDKGVEKRFTINMLKWDDPLGVHDDVQTFECRYQSPFFNEVVDAYPLFMNMNRYWNVIRRGNGAYRGILDVENAKLDKYGVVGIKC